MKSNDDDSNFDHVDDLLGDQEIGNDELTPSDSAQFNDIGCAAPDDMASQDSAIKTALANLNRLAETEGPAAADAALQQIARARRAKAGEARADSEAGGTEVAGPKVGNSECRITEPENQNLVGEAMTDEPKRGQVSTDAQNPAVELSAGTLWTPEEISVEAEQGGDLNADGATRPVDDPASAPIEPAPDPIADDTASRADPSIKPEAAHPGPVGTTADTAPRPTLSIKNVARRWHAVWLRSEHTYRKRHLNRKHKFGRLRLESKFWFHPQPPEDERGKICNVLADNDMLIQDLPRDFWTHDRPRRTAMLSGTIGAMKRFGWRPMGEREERAASSAADRKRGERKRRKDDPERAAIHKRREAERKRIARRKAP